MKDHGCARMRIADLRRKRTRFDALVAIILRCVAKAYQERVAPLDIILRRVAKAYQKRVAHPGEGRKGPNGTRAARVMDATSTAHPGEGRKGPNGGRIAAK